MSLTIIEKKLLEREEAAFKTQISVGLQHIRKAFDRYISHDINSDKRILAGSDMAKEIDDYLKETKLCDSYYYAGNYLKVSIDLTNTKSIPEALKNAMLEVAIDEFMEQVSSVESIAHDVETLRHNQGE